MNKELQYLLALVRYVFGCGDCPAYDAHVDFYKLYKLCKQHSIEALVACGIHKLTYKEQLPSEVVKKFMMDWSIASAKDVAQLHEFDVLCNIFSEQNIDYMPLKGIYLKKLYPSTELRVMADLDILFLEEQLHEVERIMKDRGYTMDHDTDHHDVYMKAPFLTVEVHQNLVDPGSRFDEYYQDVFSRVDKTGPCCYEMNWNDYYIFHVVHFIKHFILGGCGIRFLMDQYVLQTKLDNILDREYVDAELKKLEVYDFEQAMQCFVSHIFMGKDLTSFELDVMHYMLDSGVYGTEANVKENHISLDHNEVGTSKWKNWMHILFLPLASLRKAYGYVDRYPILLPVGWVHRWMKMIVFKRKRIKEVYRINSVDNHVLSNRKEFLNNIGIHERYM